MGVTFSTTIKSDLEKGEEVKLITVNDSEITEEVEALSDRRRGGARSVNSHTISDVSLSHRVMTKILQYTSMMTEFISGSSVHFSLVRDPFCSHFHVLNAIKKNKGKAALLVALSWTAFSALAFALDTYLKQNIGVALGAAIGVTNPVALGGATAIAPAAVGWALFGFCVVAGLLVAAELISEAIVLVENLRFNRMQVNNQHTFVKKISRQRDSDSELSEDGMDPENYRDSEI